MSTDGLSAIAVDVVEEMVIVGKRATAVTNLGEMTGIILEEKTANETANLDAVLLLDNLMNTLSP